MTGSINQPWAISEKFATRYGRTWANMDFVIDQTINNDHFKTDPMNVTVGVLTINGREINMKYKNLMAESIRIQSLRDAAFAAKLPKEQKFAVSVSGVDLNLKKHEISKLSETLDHALITVQRGYAVGRYL